MRFKVYLKVYLIVATMLLPKLNLYGQESVCHLFSHLAPQTDGRQLVLTGDLIISIDSGAPLRHLPRRDAEADEGLCALPPGASGQRKGFG